MMPPEQVILFIIGTIVILFGAYFVTYYVGMKASGRQTRTGLKNRNITLLDRYAISRDKQFCVVEIAGKVYIVGITNHTMTLLDTLDAEAFAELTENNTDVTPWNMTPVGQYGNKITRKIVAFIAEKTGKTRQSNISPGETGFSSAFEEAQRNAENTDREIESQDSQPENPEDD